MQRTIAVIGCGKIANDGHFPALAQIEGLKVKYACDLIIEKAQGMKDKYPELVENVITDYNIALADPEVEAVYVLTPNYSHYTITMDALRAGKHVFCEKPITVSYALSCEMAEEAKKQGKLLNIGVVNRYHKSVELLAEMNARGEFGKIYHVYASFRRYRGIPGLGGAFTTKALSGGGILIDIGVHFFDIIFYILGGAKLLNVTADTYCEMAKDIKSYKWRGDMWSYETYDENGINDVDDFVSGYIRTDKASISFNGSWAQNVDKPEMYIDILGDKKGVRMNYGGQFTIYDNDLNAIQTNHEVPNMFLAEDTAFLEAVGTGEKTKTYIDNILETMKLLDTLYASSEAKKEISFE